MDGLVALRANLISRFFIVLRWGSYKASWGGYHASKEGGSRYRRGCGVGHYLISAIMRFIYMLASLSLGFIARTFFHSFFAFSFSPLM